MEAKNREGLANAIKLVLQHKEQMDKEIWEGTHLSELGIQKGKASKENLKSWFRLVTGPGWKAGPLRPVDERKETLAAFDKWYETANEIVRKRADQEAIEHMVKELVNIKGIGYKIAGVYLKDIVYHFQVWPQLRQYLYLPIDRHTRDILTLRLKAFDEHQVPRVGGSYFTKKSKQFQQALALIHTPRVEFDYFWFIGSKFCSFLLCDVCWIRESCLKRLI